MDRVLFISYSHADNHEHKWLERLKGFLAALGEDLPLSVWDDTEISAGTEWPLEISDAIERAGAAILLVGPGLLASEFIRERELPLLLEAVKKGRLKLYPLVVGWCSWKTGTLESRQAFNDPNIPLESMSASDQNKWLNELSLAIGNDMRKASLIPDTHATPVSETHAAMGAIRDHLDTTRTAFVAQARLRDGLYSRLRERLGNTEGLEYEPFFFRHFDAMDPDELFEFKRVRAYTEGVLSDSNEAILELIDTHPQTRQELPILAALRTHLIVWLNKYEKVFKDTPEMCLVYVGVEDGVPFPTGVDQALTRWIEVH